MRFKDFIKESIIDMPRRTYAPGVFDRADTDSPILKQSVINIIKNAIFFISVLNYLFTNNLDFVVSYCLHLHLNQVLGKC